MKKGILFVTLIAMSFGLIAQDEVVNGKLTVKGNIESIKYQASASYPSLTSRGDIFQLYQNSNNILEIGVGGAMNTRRSWILSRHASLGTYGKYYSTLHLQPDVGDKTQYRGVAIGFAPSLDITAGAYLAINGKVGIGTVTPEAKLHLQTGYIKIVDNTYDEWFLLKERTDNSHKVGFKTHQNASLSIWADNSEAMRINSLGNVGIGTINPDSKLSVDGKIHAKEVKVDLIGWSDFVFEKDYKLPTLIEVENHIIEKGHLKDIPSAKDVDKNGICLGEMDAKLLQKIEELTLYTIQQEKKIREQTKEIESLKLLEERLIQIEKKLSMKEE